MIFNETAIKDAYLIEIEKWKDQRGFFARSYCKKEFSEHNISFEPVQANIGFSKMSHTLRGLHYQLQPHAEQKLVRCVKGKLYDVIIDIRTDSATYKNWIGVELSEEHYTMLYIPKGCAHGYQTLVPETEICYMVSAFYEPDSERGIRWDDPAFNIEWKESKSLIISDKDRQWPDFNE